MTARHPFKRPDKMPTGNYDVSCQIEEWPINNHPLLRWTKRSARKVRRLRQKIKKRGTEAFLVPVWTITTHP